MSKDSFKVKNGLTLTPIDPSEIVNPQAGDLIADSTDDNKIKRYDATSADWSSVGGSAGIGGNLMAEFEKLTPDLVNVTSAVDTVTFLPIDDNNKSIKATWSGSVGSIQFQVPVDSSLHEIQGTVSVWIRTSLDNIQVSSVQDDVKLSTLPVSGTGKWKQYELPVVVGGAEMGFIVESTTGVTGDVYIDQPFVGLTPSSYGFEVAQNQYLGRVNYAGAASCLWTTSSTTFANFAADADCNLATVTNGSLLQAPSTKIPAIVLPAGSPAGTYKFISSGFHYKGNASDYGAYRFSDGTNHSQESGIHTISQTIGNVIGEITYSQNLISDTTVQLQGRANSGSVEIYVNISSPDYSISVYYYPPKTTIVTTQSSLTSRTLGTLTYAGTNSCLWSNNKTTTFTSYINDPDCPTPTFSTNSDLIWDNVKRPAFTLKKGSPAGQYKVTVNGAFHNNFDTNNIACGWRFSDGTIHSTISHLYITNQSGWDSSKTFILDIDQEITADTTFILQSAGMSNGGGSCQIVNFDYSGNNSLSITVDYEPTSKNTMIVGQFEQIKSTELSQVIAAKSSPQVVSHQTFTDVLFNVETLDTNLEYNPSTGEFTAKRDMNVLVNASVYYEAFNITSTIVTFIYVNGTSVASRECLATSVNFPYNCPINKTIKLNANDVLKIVTWQNSGGLRGISTDVKTTFLTITELPDIAAIVKNLNDNKNVKCQTKYLSANTSSIGVLPDLTFTNLTIGKSYSVNFKHSISWTATQAANNVNLEYGDGTDIEPSTLGGNHNINNIVQSVGIAIKRLPITQTTLQFNLTTASTSQLLGNGTRFRTYAEVCELPDNYIETDEW